ncbi:unnamed protein product [Rhizoctonia solani]|uniref:Uncharacterized protein n=1 Tax=Rhizoctonia solani TaxID=456999 RepID=A0A8H2WLA4_9AGAM|nr:unnamed protein product [Rhizoctonia solani]
MYSTPFWERWGRNRVRLRGNQILKETVDKFVGDSSRRSAGRSLLLMKKVHFVPNKHCTEFRLGALENGTLDNELIPPSPEL